MNVEQGSVPKLVRKQDTVVQFGNDDDPYFAGYYVYHADTGATCFLMPRMKSIHYSVKHGGYSLTRFVVKRLIETDVVCVYFAEEDTDYVHEVMVSDYISGPCVPLSRASGSWPSGASELLSTTGPIYEL